MAGRLIELGIVAGDRIVVLGRNRPSFLDATLACLRSGVVPVPIDIHLPPAAVRERIDDADPALILAHPELEPLARAARRRVEVMDDDWPATARTETLSPWPLTRAMHYTSGTTGRSKGVHAGLLGADGGRALAAEEHAIWDFRPDDVHLVCGPLYHSGPHRFAVNTLLFGGSVVLVDGFDGSVAAQAIARHGVTTSFMVPTHLARLLRTDPDPAALRQVRWIAHAGAPCPAALKHRALDTFPAGTVHEFYGATEGQFTVIGPEEWRARPGSVGRARAGRVLTIVEDGRAVPPGAVGTVYTSAPEFARFEYWRDPARTAAAWDGDRFTVGDLGSIDADGYLFLAGRQGDLIISGGVNVYPAEVERVLLEHPAVFEAAVFGIPDDEWGERVCAAVVPGAGDEVDAEQLRMWARARLSGAQMPKDLVVTHELPRTGSGKVRRAALHQLLA